MATITSVTSVENIRNLTQLLGFETKTSYRAVRTRAPLEEIIILPQPRKTFNEITELGLSILEHNIIYLPVLAYFNKESFERYLAVLSLLWRTSFQIEDYLSFGVFDQEQGEIYYKVLIDGERRIRGCRKFLTEGCDEHPDVPGCYELHFGDKKVDVTLMSDISPMEALLLQSVTNTHNRVPPHEDAQFLDNLFKMFLICEPNFSIGKFSRLVGRSSETVRNAVKFCRLPKDVQEMVPMEIPYGMAGEVALLQEHLNMPEVELKEWALMAARGKYKVPDFRKIVREYIFQQENGQTSLLDLLTDKQQKELKKFNQRMVVARHLINGVWEWINYFSKVRHLLEEGKLGKNESPFSIRSPIRVFRRLIEEEKQLLPHLKDIISYQRYREAEESFQQAEVLLSQLEKVVPE